MKESRSIIARFADAARGLSAAWRLHGSVRRHVPPAVLVAAAAWWLHLSPVEVALLALAIGLVFVAELLNSAIEHTARAMTDERREELRYALDISAAAVALAALTALAVGICLFGPHLSTLFTR